MTVQNNVAVHIFPEHHKEFRESLERFIDKVFPSKSVNLYALVVGPSTEWLEAFWAAVVKTGGEKELLPVLECVLPGATRHTVIEFAERAAKRWEIWHPASQARLRQVLKYLLDIREDNG